MHAVDPDDAVLPPIVFSGSLYNDVRRYNAFWIATEMRDLFAFFSLNPLRPPQHISQDAELVGSSIGQLYVPICFTWCQPYFQTETNFCDRFQVEL